MPETGSPPGDGQAATTTATRHPAAVLPPLSSLSLSHSHHVSRSSTPGISSLDGTPRYLYAHPPAPSSTSPARYPSPPSPSAMPIRPPPFSDHGLPDYLTLPLPASARSSLPATPHMKPQPDFVPAEDHPGPPTPLREIARLLQLQRHHERRHRRVEENLHCLQVAAARTSRLVHAARWTQHTLAECIKAEDKLSFANLLHAFHEACDECFRPTSSTGLDTATRSTPEPRPTSSFLQEISLSSRTSVLHFLNKLRYDGTFIADCLESLSHKELLALLPDRSTSRSSESIFGGSTRSISRTSKPLGFVVDAQIDLLSSFSHGSPLEALIFPVAGLTTTGFWEDDRATGIWATVCAKLVSEQKSGSERFVPAVLDIWMSSLPWPGKHRLEVWILQTLQDGAFLLEQPSKQTFRARVEGRSDVSPVEEMRADSFYSKAVDSLLDLFGSLNGPSVLPPGALKMCHAISNKLSDSPGHQRALPHFLITRWLFSTFILDMMTLPEAYGLLADYYISDLARQRILREVAARTQKAAFDVAYSWKYGNSLAPELVHRVNAVISRFHGLPAGQPYGTTSHSQPSDVEIFTAVSAKDVLTALNALYPQRRPASVSSDGDNLGSGLQSSASSISGFSLFNNAKVPNTSVDGFNSSLPDSGWPRVTEPAVVIEKSDQSPDSKTMREACVELEDFLTNQTTASRDFWDVLSVPPASSSLQTMHERFLEVCPTTNALDLSHGIPLGAIAARRKSMEHVSSMRAVETLLYNFDATLLPGSLMHAAQDGASLLETEACLEALFEQEIRQYEDRSDFVEAHGWYRRLQDFRAYTRGSVDHSALRHILEDVERAARMSMDRALVLADACEKWTRVLKPQPQLEKDCLRPALEEHDRMRDKMWYVADARTSAAYDQTRSFASALRVMGKAKRQSRTRLAPPLRHWSGPRISSTSLHLKTEAQVLELLSAKPEHGGPNKLSEDQSQSVELWMDRQNIDNLCRGEERLHKLCMEIRKCAEIITATGPTENSIITNNNLFARDTFLRPQPSFQKKSALLSGLYGTTSQPNFLSLASHPRSNDALSSASRTMSTISSQDYLDLRSPTLTNKSSTTFWSPAVTEAESPSSATSVGSSRTQSALQSSSQKQQSSSARPNTTSLDKLLQRAKSFLLSDLTSTLFNDGSETDIAFWTGLGWELTDRHFRGLNAYQTSMGSQTPTTVIMPSPQPSTSKYGFEGAFGTLLQKFSAVSNPATKLACLYDIDRLLVPYLAEQAIADSPATSFSIQGADSGQLATTHNPKDLAQTSVRGFRTIFAKSSLRPKTIFRDLQYIAALIPASTLQNTAEGKAFCHAAVAITGLKQEARNIMVETADSIIAFHSNNRGHGRSPSTAQQQRDFATFSTPSRTPSAEDVSRYSMADAGYLLQIAAKEGDPIAQRELATLYLTHPDLMDRIIAPFARPKAVFKEELESKWRRNQDPHRCDPATMAIAHHWMSLSSKGGDSLAKEYLRQREEMDSF